jgi:pre-mRNA-splicing factor SYF1
MSFEEVEIPDFSLISDTDLIYEHQLIEDPTDLNSWLRYYWHKDSLKEKIWILKRSVRLLKRSYKLWVLYLDHLVELVSPLDPIKYTEEFAKANEEFERSLELLNKMPLVWVKYLEFLTFQPDVTKIRRTFNEALRTLPLTQHHWIWPPFLQFADQIGGLTGSKIYERYLQFDPDEVELVLEKLMQFKALEFSLKVFETIINDDEFVSKQGKSPLDLWLEFFDLLNSVKNPTLKHDTIVENFIRQGLVKFPDQQGRLYTQLATYFIKRKDLNKAMSVFEEGIHSVLTIRDFTMIYDSYTELQETIVTKLMNRINALEELGELNVGLGQELDFKLERFEKLMDSREYLLDDVRIRQNPNNVDNWLHKASLYPQNQIINVIQTYVDAITKIDPKKASAGLSKIWIQYSQLYEDNGDLHTARTILDKAVKVPFNSSEELVNVWIHWSELEIRQDDLETAIKVMEIATRSNDKRVDYHDTSRPVQERIHKSVKLWSFYLDLVESSGDVPKTCSVYDKVFEMKVATPLTVINYANFLEELNRFEEAFRVYEKGVNIFRYPVVFEIWNIYLTKAMKRQLGLERMRDLFDQALEGCPEDLSKTIYILYSKFEEDSGSIQRSVKILERGLDKVDLNSKTELFEILIQKTKENFGIISTRPIFSRAIESLPPSKSIPFVVKFAQMEEQLHEFPRVRAILQHGALLQSPLKSKLLWDYWSEFEVENGDKETYKEMLKWKRKSNEEFGMNFNSETLGFIKAEQKVSSINASEDKTTNPDAIDLDI